MRYNLVIKSHSAHPDYEDECEAPSKKEAAQTFLERIGGRGGDWSATDLMGYIEEDDLSDVPDTFTSPQDEVIHDPDSLKY